MGTCPNPAGYEKLYSTLRHSCLPTGSKVKAKTPVHGFKKERKEKEKKLQWFWQSSKSLHFPQADLTIILTLWTPDPRPGFEFGFVYFFSLAVTLVSLVTFGLFGLFGHLLLVTGLPLLACTSNEVLVPHTALGGWSLRSPSPQPEAGV